MLLQPSSCRSVLFLETFAGRTDKDSRIQVSDSFQITPLSWVRMYRSLMEKLMASWFLTTDRQESITWVWLNWWGLIIMFYWCFVWNIVDFLKMFSFSTFKENVFSLSLKLSMTQSNLVKSAFVNKDETFIFFSLLNSDPLRIQKLLSDYFYFYGSVVICIGLLKIGSLCNRT